MRKRLNMSDQSSEVDMTPMLDIVFIMLIFFIVTTSFVKESAIEISRPANSGDPVPNPDQRPLIIEISELEDISIAGRVILEDSVQSNVEAALGRQPDLAVIVKIDDGAATGILVNVVDQVKLAGIEQVTVSRISG